MKRIWHPLNDEFLYLLVYYHRFLKKTNISFFVNQFSSYNFFLFHENLYNNCLACRFNDNEISKAFGWPRFTPKASHKLPWQPFRIMLPHRSGYFQQKFVNKTEIHDHEDNLSKNELLPHHLNYLLQYFWSEIRRSKFRRGRSIYQSFVFGRLLLRTLNSTVLKIVQRLGRLETKLRHCEWYKAKQQQDFRLITGILLLRFIVSGSILPLILNICHCLEMSAVIVDH